MTTTTAAIQPGHAPGEWGEPRGPEPPPIFFAPAPPSSDRTPLARTLEQSVEPPGGDGLRPLRPEVRPRRKRRGLVMAFAGCLALLAVGGTAGAVGVWFALGSPLPDGLHGLVEYLPSLEGLGPIIGLATEGRGVEVVGLGEEAVILDAGAEDDAGEAGEDAEPGPTAGNNVPLEHVPAAVSGVGDALIIRATTWGRETCTVLLELRPLHRDWEVHTLARAGQVHSLELPVSREMAPAFEYYLVTTGCGSARWPVDGAHQVWLD